MANKRKALDAFGPSNGQLSAIAAAKLARQAVQAQPEATHSQPRSHEEILANAIAADPYDGGHSQSSTPHVISAEDGLTATSAVKVDSSQLSNWRPSQDNVIKNDEVCLEIILEENEAVAFVGQYDIEVVNGTISVYASAVRPTSGPLRIYAPGTHAVPLVRARRGKATVRFLTLLETGPQGLGNLSPLFRNIWQSDDDVRTFSLVDGHSKRSLDILDINREVEMVLKRLSTKVSAERHKPRIIAIGPKSSGKSTFNRVLCNHLLSWSGSTKITYLDLDPGQPEFGPPGQLSLVEVSAHILGPPFTHLAFSSSKSYKVIRSHSLAATTFREDPELYMACALDLIRRVGKDNPVVVNSCGWVAGTGAIALIDLMDSLKISDAIIFEPLDKSLLESIQAFDSAHLEIHSLPRRGPHPSARTPAEMRAMQTMSYMHQRRHSPQLNPKWTSQPLCKTRPWIVRYAGPNAGVEAILSYGHIPPQEHLAEVLDGSIVAIVTVDYDAEDAIYFPRTGHSPDQSTIRNDTSVARIPHIAVPLQASTATLNPSNSSCIGLALIHCIDQEHQMLHLHTPLLESDIAALSGRRVFLVRGSFDCPEWAYVEDLWMSDTPDDLSYSMERVDKPWASRPWISRKGMAGIEGAVWRLRHPPLPASGR